MVYWNAQKTVAFGLGLLAIFCLAHCRPGPKASLPATPTASVTPTPQVGVAFVTQAAPTAVFVPTTATPLPTATPTPSPTPVVYTIQAGDTLLAIAWQRGNTVAEIEALNPGIVPERLQIGQQIVLPPPATPLAQQAASTAVPLQITVQQIQAYRTPVGSLWLVGAVWNGGALPAENVQVAIDLHDASGLLLASTLAWVAAPVVPVGTAAPFGVLIAEPPPEFAYPVVSVAGGRSVTDLGTRYLDLNVTETAVESADTRLQVRGRLHNAGSALAGEILLLCTLYDEEGAVSGFAQQRLDSSLPPGESTTFVLHAAPPGGRAVTAVLLAQAQLMESAP